MKRSSFKHLGSKRGQLKIDDRRLRIFKATEAVMAEGKRCDVVVVGGTLM